MPLEAPGDEGGLIIHGFLSLGEPALPANRFWLRGKQPIDPAFYLDVACYRMLAPHTELEANGSSQ